MRYILALAGSVIVVVIGVAVWLLVVNQPGTSPEPTELVAESTTPAPQPVTSPAAEPQEIEADDNGEGSLRVCNETPNPVSIALGYKAPRGWQSEGWWVAGPKECQTVYNGRLDARYYYVFAADDIGGGVWDGTNFMCTRDETFTIFGVEDCLARGYERTGFFEVDTQSKSNWTLQLIDGDVVSGGSDGSEAPLEGDLPSDGADVPSD